MCIPYANSLDLLFKVGNVAIEQRTNYESAKANNEYRKQIALNNANYAKNEALRQKQLGIENSRNEKISGIIESQKLIAHNSASGIDINSQNSQLAKEDILNLSNYNAKNIQKQYDQNALSYFNQSKSYLNQIYQYDRAFNDSAFINNYNALGKIGKVAGDWYSNAGL